MSWYFVTAGYFWIFVGLTGGVDLLVSQCRDFMDGRTLLLLLSLTFCCALMLFGYGLSKERLWGKIGCALLVSILTLFFLDMLAMFAFHRNFLGFWISFGGILMGIYTLFLIVFVKRQ
jgi:hypothetical protein